jgi:ferric-dicitrate binding protein FerR (iron transport regulator)
MASCTQIDNALQAFVDGELSDSERLIVEDHVAACPACERKVRAQRRLSAMLFESFNEARLDRSLRSSVLENLPEMAPAHSSIEDMKRRVHQSARRKRWASQYVPMAAAALVCVLAVVIFQTWPEEPVAQASHAGNVTYRDGEVMAVSEYIGEHKVQVEDFVQRGSQYETASDAQLALSLDGPSVVKADVDTKFYVINERKIRLERGRLWFDVGSDGSHFLVSTPAGMVRVVGTVFGVDVDGPNTVVTVLEGTVHVERGDAAAILHAGHQIRVRMGHPIGQPFRVDAARYLAWADKILLDSAAVAAFERAFEGRALPSEVLAEVIFRLDLRGGGSDTEWSAAKMVVSWAPTGLTGHCGYHVYITDYETRKSVFKHYIDGGFLDNPRYSSYEIAVPHGTLQGANVLHVRLVPDTSAGSVEAEGLEVRAIRPADE